MSVTAAARTITNRSSIYANHLVHLRLDAFLGFPFSTAKERREKGKGAGGKGSYGKAGFPGSISLVCFRFLGKVGLRGESH